MDRRFFNTIHANSAAAVTKSDTTVLPKGTLALWVGGLGNLVVDMWGSGDDITFTAVAAGSLIPGRFKRVKDATSATLIVAFYFEQYEQ
jgi:hypothetical protein